ncbi:hypothetical protein WR25_17095 [Diploscapter pachys]|uniref:Uncharacterized protein n=1 Tax=Diploscapter pachys TaxID=2018661 RepID=A0A2A2J9N9_9BILA|nr:hypothetical protein WR25_17095 [Diploscapter pachys]
MLQSIRNSTCPFCKADEAFAVTTFNYTLLDLIPSQPKSSTQGAGECPTCHSPNQKLRVCEQCGTTKLYLETLGKHVRIKIVENDPLTSKENLARAKSDARCASCILDDETHVGHKTIELTILEEEFNFILMQRENSELHKESIKLISTNIERLPDLIQNDNQRVLQGFTQFGPRETKQLQAYIQQSFNKYKMISKEFESLKRSLSNITQYLGGEEVSVPMDIDTKPSLAVPKQEQPYAAQVSHSHTISDPTSPPSLIQSTQSAGKLGNVSSFTSASKSTISASTQIANTSSSTSFISQLGEGMEIDPAQPSTSAGPPPAPIQFDFKKEHMTFDTKIVIADRKQNKPTDPLLVGVFDIDAESYKTIGKLQTMRANYALARKDSLLFIVGGMHGGNWLALVEVYDRERNYRREVARLITARTRCSALVYNNKLYVAGGYSGVYMRSVEVWDFTGSWKETKPLNYARADAVLIEFGGKMFGKKEIDILKNKTLD